MSNNNHQLCNTELTMDAEYEYKTAECLKGSVPLRVTNKYQAFLYALFCFFSFQTQSTIRKCQDVKICKTNTKSLQNFHKPQKSLCLVWGMKKGRKEEEKKGENTVLVLILSEAVQPSLANLPEFALCWHLAAKSFHPKRGCSQKKKKSKTPQKTKTPSKKTSIGQHFFYAFKLHITAKGDFSTLSDLFRAQNPNLYFKL